MDIFGTCSDPNFTTAKINSQILDATELTGTDDGNGGYHLHATATVKAEATPEWWPVSFHCGDTMVAGNFLVTTPDVSPVGTIGIRDERITPGKKVTVHAECWDPEFTSSPVTSPVLNATDVTREPGQTEDVVMMASATVNKNAKPGDYLVSFTCAGKEISTTFAVVTGAEPKPVTPVKKNAQVPVKPKGAADTGSLDTAAPAAEEGSDTGLLVLGGSALAALGAAGGVGAWAYRRRQRA